MFYERVRLSFEFGSQVKSESCRHTDLEARPVITQLDHFEKVYSPNICINFVLTFFFCFVTTKCQKCINYQIRLVQLLKCKTLQILRTIILSFSNSPKLYIYIHIYIYIYIQLFRGSHRGKPVVG